MAWWPRARIGAAKFSSPAVRVAGARTRKVKVGEGETVESALNRALEDPEVAAVQPNYIYQLNALPTDPQFSSQYWSLKNTGQKITFTDNLSDVIPDNNPGMKGADINAEGAWDIRTDCSSTVVAIVDTGINYKHKDLAGQMWNGNALHGANFASDSDDPFDDHGHGTHVAGTVGAQGGNGVGGVGLCWKAKLMAVKVLDEDGSGTSEGVAAGMRFAADNGARIMNLSLGGPGFDYAMRPRSTR